MSYIENPKTAGSGILCCIPQTGRCPNGCKDCFFQSGRSYLEPLTEHLPNMPTEEQAAGMVVRVNDGNDSAVDLPLVVAKTANYKDRFFNTATGDPGEFPGPVVVTVNPGKHTDHSPRLFAPTPNLMFVRVRTNTWNLSVVDAAITWYTRLFKRPVPVVLTFMAYQDVNDIPPDHRPHYVERIRTTNSYWAITTAAWKMIMDRCFPNKLVYSCGTLEGELGDTKCKYCGNCLREYYATKTRLQQGATHE